MAKRRRKLTAAEKRKKKRRQKGYMTIFIKGKQKRIKRPPNIYGMDEEEFLRRNADPIWLHQNDMWEHMAMIRFENSNIENMPTSIEIPKKCHDCRKYARPITHGQCTFCQTLAFQERILCDLSRRVQHPENFECFAFTPTLKLVGSSKQDELCAMTCNS